MLNRMDVRSPLGRLASGRRTAFIVTGVGAIVVAATVISPAPTARGGAPSTALDASAARVLLAPGDLDAFTVFPAPCYRLFPDKGIHNGDTPIERSLLAYCIWSAITNNAVYGEGRVQIDAFARSVGYEPRPGLWPFTPIGGDFVATHHGIFEIYDTLIVFDSEEMAHERFVRETYSRASMLTNYHEAVVSRADESKTWSGVFGSDASARETQYVTEWRRGRVVAWVNTMGAADLTAEDNERLVGIVDQRIQSAFGD